MQSHFLSSMCHLPVKIIRAISMHRLPLIIASFSLLLSCSGSDGDDDDLPEIRLSSLEVSGYEVEFDPLAFGPYEIEVASDVETVQITVDRSRDELEWSYRQDSDGTTGTFDIDSSGSFVVELEDGNNIISILLEDTQEEDSVTYIVDIYRISSSASIRQFSFNALGSEAAVILDPGFDEAVLSYQTTVPYTTCSVAYQIQTNREETITEVNDEEIDVDENQFLNLDVGDNFVDAIVTSEDGSRSERYSVVIDRENPTDEELEQDATIEELTLEPLGFEFICGIFGYNEIIDNEVGTITVNVSPTVDGVDITINGQQVNREQDFDIEIEEEGTIEISITSLDGSRMVSYSIAYVRSSTNLIEVDTTEELQQALRNAQPNDEIRIEPGTYLGVASAEQSGDDEAHFFSDRSGTALDPIYLLSADSSDDVILRGDPGSVTAALKITGRHWIISGIEIHDSHHALILDGAEDVRLDGVEIENTVGNGLIIRNGSRDNIIANTQFSDIGTLAENPFTDPLAAILVGSDGEDWLGAPEGNGRFDPDNHNNSIRHSEFLSLEFAQAIRIEEGAQDTHVEYNLFAEEDDNEAFSRESLIRNQGNDSVFRYNTFEYPASPNITALITIKPAEASWHNENWGENSVIYQNMLDLDNRDIVFVNADGINRVDAVENQRRDEGNVRYQGSGIDQMSFSVPVFQIRPVEDERRCLGIAADADDEIADDEDNAIDEDTQFLFLEDCTDDISQVWKPIVDDDAYVLLQNQAQPGDYLRTVSGFVSRCGTTSGTSYSYLAEDEFGFNQRWYLDPDEDGELYIRSKRQRTHGLTVEGASLSLGKRILTCPIVSERQQRFRLVEQ